MNKNVKIIVGILSIVVVISMSMIGLTIYNNLKDKEDDSANNNYFVEQNTTPEADEMYKKYLKNLEENIRKNYSDNENDFFYEREVFESVYLANQSIVVSLDKKLRLSIKINDEKVLISDNVLDFFIVEIGNAGWENIYFIKNNGSVFAAPLSDFVFDRFDRNDDLYELPYKNIISVSNGHCGDKNSDGASPIFTDIEGNLYIGN